MSMGTSRDKRTVGLIPNNWVIGFQKEDYVGNPAFQFHELAFTFEVDPGIVPATNPSPDGSSSNVYCIVQTSPDGVTWTTIWSTGNNPCVPGGHKAVSVVHNHRWVRACFYSHGVGRVDCAIHHWEDQILPNYLEGANAPHPLSCSTWCQVDCETGNETLEDDAADR